MSAHRVPMRLGERFGRLVVMADGASHAICACDCGVIKPVAREVLTRKRGTRSCGCLMRDEKRLRATHGHTRGKDSTAEYRAWRAMRDRCERKAHVAFKHYGGRGIKVCERWQKFENFVADMGMRTSPRHSLDRIDNARGYEPGNCRWATSAQQLRNTRVIKLTEHDVIDIRTLHGFGARKTDLANAYGVSFGLVSGIVKGIKWI